MLRDDYQVRRTGAKVRIQQVVVLLSCLALSAYFAFHAVKGRHGLEARNQLIERSELLDFEIKSLEAVRSKLERDVALLASEVPNPDLVEEIARDVLGYVRSTDRLVKEN